MPIRDQKQLARLAAILTPEEALAEFGSEDARRLYFPREVRVTLADRRMVRWPPGFHTVPAPLADHRYLAACRVRELPAGSEEAITTAKQVLDEEASRPAVGYHMQPVRVTR